MSLLLWLFTFRQNNFQIHLQMFLQYSRLSIIVFVNYCLSLREKCSNTELFLVRIGEVSAFAFIPKTGFTEKIHNTKS